jgi:arginyl-tRNA synthetase
MAAYALQLAGAFNDYYRDHRVLECEDAAQRALRLAMVQAAQKALAKALGVLAIPALDTM